MPFLTIESDFKNIVYESVYTSSKQPHSKVDLKADCHGEEEAMI